MDSTGLAALIQSHQLTTARRGRLALVTGAESVRRTIEVRGLDRLFVLAPTREEALAAVRDPSDRDSL
jgi:anti-anti-sigma factor